jgi:hypothetical protein
MKKILKSLGLLALVAAMIYSSLSLMPKKVSADGVTCCLANSANSGCTGPGMICVPPTGTASCNNPGNPNETGFCVKKCNADMECDEDGGVG